MYGSELGVFSFWKWHTGWCPGWNSYVKALPDERRTAVLAKYHREAEI